MMRFMRWPIRLALAAVPLAVAPVAGQPVTRDPVARLREVLPADVADRVLARIAAAREHGLPAEALEQRALKFAAKGVAPAEIERAVREQADRLEQARDALRQVRGDEVRADEVEAGAEALRQGVDGSAVSALAKSAPSGRSLAVPLYVLGSLVARGLPADEALAEVRDRLAARASDAELEALPARAPVGGGRADAPGADVATTHRPSVTPRGGPPAGVPANGGRGVRPITPERPPKQPPHGRP